MAVPQLDLIAQNQAIAQELEQAFSRILATGGFLLGPYVESFETELARLCECDHAVALASGTDALLVALMALDIGPGDEVIVPSFTFFATAGSVHRVGATPVFVDIEPGSFNLDPAAVEAAITPRTRAIMPVHLFGLMADMDRLLELAQKHDIQIIEDAAQAIAARWRGRPAGGVGRIGCLSFYPTKNLAGIGDGGAVVTGDAELAARCRSLRNHGQTGTYEHQWVGGNFRLDAIQGAALGLKIKLLDNYTQLRRQAACRYHQALAGSPLVLPDAPDHAVHVYNQYTVRVPDGRRDALLSRLQEQGIAARVYYPKPLHLQPCFAHLKGLSGRLEASEAACGQVMSLPIFPELTSGQQEEVCRAIKDYFS
ncbi:MAG: DegT/DnrJ/EryC1/StrS family aminotransferase [Phycisphaeraceae bacterium]|nr:DegT/DnrJ/EryC1/StrS family aminotransferase [Phycisphaeraceae bacterium]